MVNFSGPTAADDKEQLKSKVLKNTQLYRFCFQKKGKNRFVYLEFNCVKGLRKTPATKRLKTKKEHPVGTCKREKGG